MQRRGLIVDDETAVCEMVGKVLTSAGIEAMTLTKSIDAPGSVARVMGRNQMGIQLDQLSADESERLQEFLLPLIPSE